MTIGKALHVDTKCVGCGLTAAQATRAYLDRWPDRTSTLTVALNPWTRQPYCEECSLSWDRAA